MRGEAEVIEKYAMGSASHNVSLVLRFHCTMNQKMAVGELDRRVLLARRGPAALMISVQ